MKVVRKNKMPKAIGPYSQVVRYGDFIFCSGQIPINPETGKLVGKSIENQTKQALLNLSAVLEKANSSLSKVLKTTVYLANIDYFERFNKIYADFFSETKPARATVEVSKLPKEALIEIEAIASI